MSRFGFRSLLGLATAFALFAPLPAWAAEGLFQPARGEVAGVRAKSLVAGTKRHRIVEVDAAVLARTIAPLGLDDDPGRLDKMPSGSEPVVMELFPDVPVRLRREFAEAADIGGFAWSGRLEGSTPGIADLIVKNGQITGTVTVGNRLFRIDPLPSGTGHQVSEMDPGFYPRDLHLDAPKPRGGSKPQRPTDSGNARKPTVRTITVLVGYTKDAADVVVSAPVQAQFAVSSANAAFARSGVGIRFKLVGTMSLGTYDEGAAEEYADVLYELTTKVGQMATLQTQRDVLKADLVSVFVARSEYCGVAWVVTTPNASTADYGMSVVTIDCVTNQTFAHETGHNMGLYHDRFVEPIAGNDVYNYGYVNPVGNFRDIMSYPNACPTCARISYFSTPRVRYNNYPIGIKAGSPGAADGARKLNENALGIASYR